MCLWYIFLAKGVDHLQKVGTTTLRISTNGSYELFFPPSKVKTTITRIWNDSDVGDVIEVHKSHATPPVAIVIVHFNPLDCVVVLV